MDNEKENRLLTWPQRKNIISDGSILVDDGESNGRNIMERFLVVGILCSHVVADSRPTILDTLKMLEGDIEVPSIPARPMTFENHMFTNGDYAEK
ncbi:hypothetical protein RYX36_034285 [Vicia faba]